MWLLSLKIFKNQNKYLIMLCIMSHKKNNSVKYDHFCQNITHQEVIAIEFRPYPCKSKPLFKFDSLEEVY